MQLRTLQLFVLISLTDDDDDDDDDEDDDDDDDDLLDDELLTMFQVNQGDRLRLHEQILLPVFWLTVRLIVRFAVFHWSLMEGEGLGCWEGEVRTIHIQSKLSRSSWLCGCCIEGMYGVLVCVTSR